MIARSRFASAATSLALLAVLIGLAACGGGGSSAPSGGGPPPTSPATSPTTAPTGAPTSTPTAAGAPATTFVLVVPAAGSGATSRSRTSLLRSRPLYVSPNTGSVAVTLQSVNGAAVSSSPVVVRVASGAPGCANAAAGLTCTFSVPARAGDDVYAIATYQSSAGGGPVLASTAVVAMVGASGGPTIDLDLNGVPAGIGFSPSALPLVDDGSVQRVPVAVEAVDASGAAIVGAAPYQSPVSLAIVGDGAHALSLSTVSVSQPGTIVTVTYDSSRPLGAAQIVATDGGTQASLAAAPLSIVPDPIDIKDDAGTFGVTLGLPGYTGSFAATIANPSDASVAVVPGTANSGAALVNVSPKVELDTTTLTVSAGGISATVPLTIYPDLGAYAAFGPTQPGSSLTSLIAGPNGKLWGANPANGSVFSFDPATGAYSAYTVDASRNGPQSIAFDATGALWFADGPQIGRFVPATQAITTYSAGLEPNAAITRIVAGPAATTMWFYDAGGNGAFVHANTTYLGSISVASGAISEYATTNSAGPNYYAGLPEISLVLGSDGAIWFSDELNASIGRVSATGAISEYALGDPAHPQQSPTALAAGPDGRIWTPTYGISSGTSTLVAIDPGSKVVTYYESGTPVGYARAATFASDGNLWYVLTAAFGPNGLTPNSQLTVASKTGAFYEYPQFGVVDASTFDGLVSLGTDTLYLEDAGLGELGKVTFR